MPDTSVKVYRSSDAGAPSLSGTAGALIGVLQVLVDGCGSVTVDSLVVASDVATATVSGGHQFTMIGDTGPVIRISGASPGGLNADVRITVTSPTQFTFATSGISDQTATGTISAKRAPAGYSWLYTDTNKGVLKRDAVEATGMVLRIDDTPAQYPTLIMYESMTDVDTGSGPAPTSGSLWFGKSSAANGTARDWVLIADPQAFYLFCKSDGGSWYSNLFFGDPLSFYSADAYQATLIAHYSASYTSGPLHLLNATNGMLMAREKTQTGAAISVRQRSHLVSGASIGSAGASYTEGVDPFFCSPVNLWNASGSVCRALMPGLYSPLHPYTAFTQGQIIEDLPNLSGRTLWMQKLFGNYVASMDMTGPWR